MTKSTRLFLAFLALLMAVVFSISIRGQLATHPDASSPPVIKPPPAPPAPEPIPDTYVIQIRDEDGTLTQALAHSDGKCRDWRGDIIPCNGTVRIAIPTRGIDDTHGARISTSSTGAAEIDLILPPL